MINTIEHISYNMEEREKLDAELKTGKHLCRYTVEGTFSGEARATRELLSNENNIPIEDIDVKLMYQGRKGCWKEYKGA